MYKLAQSALIGSLFVLIGANQSAHATNYFSWGAETMTPTWGAKGSATGPASLRSQSSIDSSVFHSGSKSLKVQPTGSGTNESTGIDLNGTPPSYPFGFLGSQLYYRWWMRIEPGFSWGNNFKKSKAGRPNLPNLTAQWYTGYIGGDEFVISECTPEAGHAGGCLPNDGSAPYDGSQIHIAYNLNSKADGKWHEYIARVKVNTIANCTVKVDCDAQFEMYVDGVSVGSYNNWKLTPTDGQFIEWWGSWMTNPYFQMGSTVPAGGTIYLDDFSTDDTWNSQVSPSGPGGSAIPTPPAPTGLSVK